MWNWNLIRLFEFYLALAFLFSTYRRLSLYGTMVGLVLRVSRWPRLMKLVKGHVTVFVT